MEVVGRTGAFPTAKLTALDAVAVGAAHVGRLRGRGFPRGGGSAVGISSGDFVDRREMQGRVSRFLLFPLSLTFFVFPSMALLVGLPDEEQLERVEPGHDYFPRMSGDEGT